MRQRASPGCSTSGPGLSGPLVQGTRSTGSAELQGRTLVAADHVEHWVVGVLTGRNDDLLDAVVKACLRGPREEDAQHSIIISVPASLAHFNLHAATACVSVFFLRLVERYRSKFTTRQGNATQTRSICWSTY
jgi:hypothetical protein